LGYSFLKLLEKKLLKIWPFWGLLYVLNQAQLAYKSSPMQQKNSHSGHSDFILLVSLSQVVTIVSVVEFRFRKWFALVN
jgi:hypothetical protein